MPWKKNNTDVVSWDKTKAILQSVSASFLKFETAQDLHYSLGLGLRNIETASEPQKSQKQ